MSGPDATIEIVEAVLTCPEHEDAIREMLDAYSRDPMGNGRPLDADVRERLIPALRDNPTTVVFLAYDGTRPVGIATCFRGLSTFAARPLLNLHDLAVIAEYRGQGVGRRLLAAVEEKARALGCCKVTLEVLEANPARAIYEASGYASLEYGNGAGRSLFLTKMV
ncbi:MAG: GNAT family N-acetyltransferase [Pirellulales bacterium]